EADLDINNTIITGDNITLSSFAASDAEAQVLTVIAAVAVGVSQPHASIDITNGSSIRATGDLSISTLADSDLSIVATQNLVGTSTTAEDINITAAGSYSDLISKANLSADSTLDVGNDLTIDVEGTREHNTQANAAAYADGTLGVALNVAIHEANLEALIDGTVVTGGDMSVSGDLETLKNDFNATSTVGTGQLAGRLQQTKAGGILRAFSGGYNSIFGGATVAGADSGFRRNVANIGQNLGLGGGQQPNQRDLSAALNVGIGINDVEVRIGPGASVTVGGDLSLRGHVEEFPETSAIAFLNSSNDTLAGAGPGTYSQRETGYAGAFTVGYFQNDVDVYVGNNANVSVGQDMTIVSESSIPYDPQFIWDTRADDFENPARITTYTDKFNYNLGIQNGFFSSWAEAIAGAQTEAIGIMTNVLIGDTHNYVYIGDGARVTVGGDLSVISDTANDTINFVGSPLIPFNASKGRTIGAAFMATGYVNDTTARINPLAEIEASSLLVLANNHGRVINIGIQGSLSDGLANTGNNNFGARKSGGFNGIFSTSFVDNRTISKISPAASITLDDSGTVEIPLNFETLDGTSNDFQSPVPMFGPAHFYDADNEDRRRVSDTENTISLPYGLGLETGDPIYYDSRGGDDIGGLDTGTVYFAVLPEGSDGTVIQLALSYADATASDPVIIELDLDDIGDDLSQNHTIYPGVDPFGGDVSVSDSEITHPTLHGFVSGQAVVYHKGDDANTEIGGLEDGESYFVYVTGESTYRLAHTQAEAENAELTGDLSQLITLSSGATGRGHVFFPGRFSFLKKPVWLLSLDSNQDGKLGSEDEHIVGVNNFVALGEDPNVQTNVNMLVLAEDQSNLFTGTGSITKTLSKASGVTLNVGVVNRNTQAFIGSEERVLDDSPFVPGLGVDSTELIVLDYDHGYSVGDTLVYTAGGDAPIGGLRDCGIYTVIEVPSSNTFRIGRSADEGTAFGGPAFSASTNALKIDLGYDHGYQTADAIEFTVTDVNIDVEGLESGTTYYVVYEDDQTIGLAENVDDITEQFIYQVVPQISILDDTISLGHEHDLPSGQRLQYRSGGGAAIGGLTDGHVYEVVRVDDDANVLQLRDPDTDSVVELDPFAATGVAHTFHPVVDQNAFSSSSGDRLTGTIDLGYQHELVTGDPVRFEGGDVGGLADDTRYYAIVIDDTTIALSRSEERANQGRTQFFDPAALLEQTDDGNDSTFDTIDVYAEHGFQDGDQVLYQQNGGPTIGGLTDGEIYTVKTVTEDDEDVADTKLQLLDSSGSVIVMTTGAIVNSSLSASLVNLSPRVDLTGGNDTTPLVFYKDARIQFSPSAVSVGETPFSVSLSLDSVATKQDNHGFAPGFDPSSAVTDADDDGNLDTIDLGYNHGYSAGQAVTYTAGNGRVISGINEGQVYYVRLVSGSTSKLQLAETFAQAVADTASPEVLKYDITEVIGTNHSIGSVLRPVAPVDGGNDTINFGRSHGLVTGDLVVYDAGGGDAIGGLVDGQSYSVERINDRTIQLRDSAGIIDLDATLATGTNHRFRDVATDGTATIDIGGDLGIVATNSGTNLVVT
ncbi:MAG TPA: hypothetical protein DDW52_18705, partial [Planctomycetaceae bacterium]|nr:hypothetical protein [Planctomycetaceae bacterium]